MSNDSSHESTAAKNMVKTRQTLKIAAFDVDGTLTFTDSFLLFLRFTTTRTGFVIRLISVLPVFAAYLLRLTSRDTAKNALLRAFLKGMPVSEYYQKCEFFAKSIYPQILHSDAIDYLENEKGSCDKVALVSASLQDYLFPFAKSIGIEYVIATKMDVKDGFLTGNMNGLNCRGIEKCNRIHEIFGECIIEAAYGDSAGDTQMLGAAQRAYWRTINKRPKNYRAIINALFWGKSHLY